MNITTLETQAFRTTDEQILAREYALAALHDVMTAKGTEASDLASKAYRKRLVILCRVLGTTDERAVGNAVGRMYDEVTP